MSALLCFFEVIFGTSCYNLALERDVVLKHLLEGENLRLAADKGEHDNAESRLKLSERIKLI